MDNLKLHFVISSYLINEARHLSCDAALEIDEIADILKRAKLKYCRENFVDSGLDSEIDFFYTITYQIENTEI